MRWLSRGRLVAMDEKVRRLLTQLETGPPTTDVAALVRTAAEHDVLLPTDYLEFMLEHDGGEGDVGSHWLQLWSAARIISTAGEEARYHGVLLFAGDGANTV